jgi:hypothetical protein
MERLFADKSIAAQRSGGVHRYTNDAYRRVKANDWAASVDGTSMEEFDRDLKGNLYKLWNRLSSGVTSQCQRERTKYRGSTGKGGDQSPRRARG